MSKHCSVIIYLFVLVGGGVDFTNARILIRMHGEIKQASPQKQGMLALSTGITPIINLRYHKQPATLSSLIQQFEIIEEKGPEFNSFFKRGFKQSETHQNKTI